jgi:hypothetical protein
MVLNQLFIEKPPNELLNRIIKAFGLNDLNDKKEFSQIDLDRYNTLIILQTMETELKECYIPCKQKKYLDNINYKGAITIFRQILKAFDYDLFSKEKFIKGTKYLVYKIVTKQEKDFFKKNKKPHSNQEFVIVFD